MNSSTLACSGLARPHPWAEIRCRQRTAPAAAVRLQFLASNSRREDAGRAEYLDAVLRGQRGGAGAGDGVAVDIDVGIAHDDTVLLEVRDRRVGDGDGVERVTADIAVGRHHTRRRVGVEHINTVVALFAEAGVRLAHAGDVDMVDDAAGGVDISDPGHRRIGLSGGKLIAVALTIDGDVLDRDIIGTGDGNDAVDAAPVRRRGRRLHQRIRRRDGDSAAADNGQTVVPAADDDLLLIRPRRNQDRIACRGGVDGGLDGGELCACAADEKHGMIGELDLADAIDGVVGGAGIVGAGGCRDGCGRTVPRDGVVGRERAVSNGIVAGAAVDGVGACATLNGVVMGATGDREAFALAGQIDADASGRTGGTDRLDVDDLRIERVVEIARCCGEHDRVRAVAAIDRVGANEAVDGVVTGAGVDIIGAAIADDIVVTAAAGEHIVSAAAEDLDRFTGGRVAGCDRIEGHGGREVLEIELAVDLIEVIVGDGGDVGGIGANADGNRGAVMAEAVAVDGNRRREVVGVDAGADVGERVVLRSGWCLLRRWNRSPSASRRRHK